MTNREELAARLNAVADRVVRSASGHPLAARDLILSDSKTFREAAQLIRESAEARVDPTKVIGICRNPGEPFFWDAERIGEPCPDADCSRNAEDAGLEPPRHGYYVLASTTEAPDDE